MLNIAITYYDTTRLMEVTTPKVHGKVIAGTVGDINSTQVNFTFDAAVQGYTAFCAIDSKILADEHVLVNVEYELDMFDPTHGSIVIPGEVMAAALYGRITLQLHFVNDTEDEEFFSLNQSVLSIMPIIDDPEPMESLAPGPGKYVLSTRTINGYPLSADIWLTKSDIGLGNVDNTSDMDKPISAATQAALDSEEQAREAADLILTNDLANHIANVNNPHNVTKTQIGLSNVDNTSDAAKPISDATQIALDAKQNVIDNDHKLSADLVADGVTNKVYTSIEKDKLAGIENGADVNIIEIVKKNGTELTPDEYKAINIIVPTKTSDIDNDSGFITKSVSDLENYTRSTDLAQVATSGSYNDLSDKPTVDQSYSSSSTNAQSGTAVAGAISGKENANNKVSTINPLQPPESTSVNYPTDYAVKTYVDNAIATEAATFCGTKNVITDLGLTINATQAQVAEKLAEVISGADNNDYCFVAFPHNASETTVIARYDRYKYVAGAQSPWTFEYSLTNTTFTSDQWAAINSTITSAKVSKYEGYQAQIDGKQAVIDGDNKLSSDLVDDTDHNHKFVTTAEKTTWNNKLDRNDTIEGDTKCKITYDSKGLVTGGANLQESDIPGLHLSKITDVASTAAEINVLHGSGVSNADLTKLHGVTATAEELNHVDGVTSNIQIQINGKVTANNGITGSTKCKITYDSKGLVTAGESLSEGDIPNLSLSKITDVTASYTEVNVLDGITSTTAELNYVHGVTSNVQTQLNSKANSSALPTIEYVGY